MSGDKIVFHKDNEKAKVSFVSILALAFDLLDQIKMIQGVKVCI